MSPFRRFGAWFRKRALDAEMAEEIRLHLEQRIQENISAGMSPEAAQQAARRKFGGVEQVKEIARQQRSFAWLEHLYQDVCYALRQLSRAWGFTTVVVLILALGIGATAAIYTAVDTVVLNPVPGPHPERVVQIGEWIQHMNRPNRDLAGASPPVLEALVAHREFFQELMWFDQVSLDLKGDDFDTLITGALVPTDFFEVLGARLLLGRVPAADEVTPLDTRGQPARDSAIVLSHAWWRSQFGGDRNVLGTAIELSGRHFRIVGVMPRDFRFPGWNKFWMAAEPVRPHARTTRAPNAGIIARLKPGVTLEQTQAMLDTLARRLLADHVSAQTGYGKRWSRADSPTLQLWVLPSREFLQDERYARTYGPLRQSLLGFLGAIGFVLAIVCANVANLSLARTERRRHELAIRAALGAGRGRLFRQLLTENLLLALLGGAGGLLFAGWFTRLLAAFTTMPTLRPIAVDARTIGAALAVSILTGLIFGLAPAWQARRIQISQTNGLGITAGARESRLRAVLVVAQVALAVVLLAGAGLMIRSVARLLHVDPGFEPANLIAVELRLRLPREPEMRSVMLGQLHERIAALPGVSAAGIFKDDFGSRKFLPEGFAEPVLLDAAHCGWEESDFFRAARIPLVSGRYFDRSDTAEGRRTVIVNETLAQLCWPGENAIGKTFRALQERNEPEYEVVGVVGDVRLHRFDETLRPVFYRPYTEAGLVGTFTQLLVRTHNDPAGVLRALPRELKAVVPDMRQPHIAIFRELLFDATQARRTYRNYLVAFAGAGLLLAALGIFGVLAYSVARRTREIGVRMAIGAERRTVLAMIMREGGRLIVVGVVVGLVAAFWLMRFLQHQLYEISPHDPIVLSGAVAVLAMAGLLACYLPARRAARVDPVVALRHE